MTQCVFCKVLLNVTIKKNSDYMWLGSIGHIDGLIGHSLGPVGGMREREIHMHIIFLFPISEENWDPRPPRVEN